MDPVKTLDVTIPNGPLSRSLRSQIEQAIALNVPEGKTGAVMAVLDPQKGPQFGFAYRKGDHWRICAEAQATWSLKDVSGQVAVVYTF